MPGVPLATNRRIGLLGGSFNPAHAGHLHVSREALRRLGLDEVWWLVSPQNPLKAAEGMAVLAQRLARAKEIGRDPRLRIAAPEAALGTRYTVDTLEALKPLLSQGPLRVAHGGGYPAATAALEGVAALLRHGADCSAGPAGLLPAGAGRTGGTALRCPPPSRCAARLPTLRPPAWCFIRCRLDTSSATVLRATPTK